MFRIVLFASIISTFFVRVLSQECLEDTFPRVPVFIQQNEKEEYQYIQKCISSTNLDYVENQLKKVIITKQHIPSLGKGAIFDIPETFIVLLHNNNITTVKEQAFLNLPGLTDIGLNQNEISSIESKAFFNLSSLGGIDLENNLLEQLEQDTFSSLPNLTIISLSKNRLNSFRQDWFYKTPRLQLLIIDNNNIESLTRGAFRSFPELQGVDFSNNKIRYIHKEAFEKLEKLKEVTFSNNRLTSFDVDFGWSPNLRSLSLDRNNVTYVSDELLLQIQHSLKSLWVNSNPLQCPCLDKLFSWATENNVHIAYKCKNKNVVCVVPKTRTSDCVERSVDDFHTGFYELFVDNCHATYDPL